MKKIDNAIYRTIQKTATINGVSFNDGVETWINAEDSDITGYEFNFQQDFEFLPAPFDGMFIALNLTWTDGDSTCLLYTSPSPRDMRRSRMPSSA